jgi:hypothetical protein
VKLLTGSIGLGDLPMFDDLKIRLDAGEFTIQKEIADYCGKSKPMGGVYIEKGIKLGLWTKVEGRIASAGAVYPDR